MTGNFSGDTSTTTCFSFGKKIMVSYETRQTTASGQDIYDVTSETLYYVFPEENEQTNFNSMVTAFRSHALELQDMSVPSSADPNCSSLKTFTGGYRICVFDEQDEFVYREQNLFCETDAVAPPIGDGTTTRSPYYDETTTSSYYEEDDTRRDDRILLFSSDELFGSVYENIGEDSYLTYLGMLVYKGELPPYCMALGAAVGVGAVVGSKGTVAIAGVVVGLVFWGVSALVSPSESYYYSFTSLSVTCNGITRGLYGYSDTQAHGPYDSVDAAQSQMEAAIASAEIPQIYRNQFAETDQLTWYFNGVITDRSNNIVRRFEQPQD